MAVIEFDESTHTYTVEGERKPSVTEILSMLTMGHYSQINESVLRAAAERGKDVHQACQDIDLGLDEEEYDPVIAPYAEAYMQFLFDYSPKWLEIEQPHYNKEWGFCGTVDRYGIINGRPSVVDIKTTASPTRENYLSYCCQTIGYSTFYPVSFVRNKSGLDGEYKKPERYILFLKKDGKYRLVNCEEYEEKNNWFTATLFADCLKVKRDVERSLRKDGK